MQKQPTTGDMWGPWTYNKELQTVTIQITPTATYEVRIDEIRNDPSRHLPDWLAQLAEKSWMDATKMGHFVYAVDSILGIRELARY